MLYMIKTLCYTTAHMTLQTLTKAIKGKKPAIVKERGEPRFVILDWKDYKKLKEATEDNEDAARLLEALADPANQERIPLTAVRKKLGFS
jgi:PHD/YefM family antitoxin component YafN of YafNO toxin-antitoxin module